MCLRTIMKKTLLTSALAVIALAASAQSQVASPAGEFEFITKNLTVGGKIIPASLVKDEENDKYDFTIYNSSFNTEKNFSLPRHRNTYTVKTLEAQAPFTVSNIVGKDDYEKGNVEWYDQNTGEPKSISTLDDWKAYVSQMFGSDWVAFTDAEEHFAAHRSDGWMNLEEVSNGSVIMRQSYLYYDNSNNKIMQREARVSGTISTDNLTWTEAGSDERSVTSELLETYLKDYDANCAEDYDNKLTQSLFNNDDKFEVVMEEYKETTAADAEDDGSGNNVVSNAFPYQITGMNGDKVILQKNEQDKYYKSYISVVNEDGKEIVALPESSYDVELAKVDGKLYMMVYAYKDGKEQTIIYSVDNVNTSITELARTNAVKSRKTFNMAGMQVSKDAKGIVIQQGGKKYINK